MDTLSSFVNTQKRLHQLKYLEAEDISHIWRKLELDTQYAHISLDAIYLTLGGFDDFVVVVWNVAEGKPIALKYTNFIRFFNNSDESFVTGGKSNPRIWDIDYKNIKLICNEIVQGHMRRIWTTAVIDNDDKYAYLGSTTEGIIAFDIHNYYLKHFGPVKDKDKLQAVRDIITEESKECVFSTQEELNYWIAVQDNVAKLVNGDNFYIVNKEITDYWRDGSDLKVLKTELLDVSNVIATV
ncbi:MAG: hypothetical protein EZS28_039228 [Streblomastix strix]|uniref:Uncharacterized protein n=1 Tax=Streblomastix strix TaxID=222440 RepID=A0A5J4U6A1_9EUKA|nr:MAG: hypothetical protein EZS28_039228 [Streblomastix strix]